MNEEQVREEIVNLHEMLRHVHDRLRVLERKEQPLGEQIVPSGGAANQLLRHDGSGPDWQAFDWDLAAAAAGADMAHTHQSAGEGGQIALAALSDHSKANHDTLGIDHGSLSGKADDDHTQYLLASGARTGAASQKQQFTYGIRADGSIDLYYGGTLVGQLSLLDTTWFRLNQGVAKNIYTPRMFRTDGGLVSGALAASAGQVRATGLIETTADYLKSAKAKRGLWRLGSNLNLASMGTAYTLAWSGEVVNVGGFTRQASNTQIRCPENGTYTVKVNALVQYRSSTTDIQRVDMLIRLNGAVQQRALGQHYKASADLYNSLCFSADVDITDYSTDYIDVQAVWVSSGISPYIYWGSSSDVWTQLHITKVN